MYLVDKDRGRIVFKKSSAFFLCCCTDDQIVKGNVIHFSGNLAEHSSFADLTGAGYEDRSKHSGQLSDSCLCVPFDIGFQNIHSFRLI